MFLHGPFNELFPCAIDPKARRLAAQRYRQACGLAASYGADKVVIHAGFVPNVYYPCWYTEQSILFWREFLKDMPENRTICLENVMESDPAWMRDIVKEVNDPRLAICLDVGHANVCSRIPVSGWLETLGPWIRHFHIHNNDSRADTHYSLGAGEHPNRGCSAPGAGAGRQLYSGSDKRSLGCRVAPAKGTIGGRNMTLKELITRIQPLDEAAMEAARRRQDALAKPPRSLGRLEDLSIQLAGITGKVQNTMDKTHLLVFAADNGVVEEGVSSAPQSVTLMQTVNLTRAKTGASVLCKHFGAGITVCDVGVNAIIREPAVLDRKIAFGTQNIAKGPAMTREQAEKAILIGAQLAMDTPADALGVGEMGIGNTTTSSAVLAVLLGVPVETVTGRGGGITDESFQKKKQVIAQAIALNQPNGKDPVDVLQKVGGFDLAAMCGAFLGAAASHRPVVIDGFISVVAALCAARLCPAARDYYVPSHLSYEIGYRLALEELRLEPIFQLGMRLGEGSGCPLAFQVLSAACSIINDMATFDQAGIDDGYLEEIREGDKFTVEARK